MNKQHEQGKTIIRNPVQQNRDQNQTMEQWSKLGNDWYGSLSVYFKVFVETGSPCVVWAGIEFRCEQTVRWWMLVGFVSFGMSCTWGGVNLHEQLVSEGRWLKLVPCRALWRDSCYWWIVNLPISVLTEITFVARLMQNALLWGLRW